MRVIKKSCVFLVIVLATAAVCKTQTLFRLNVLNKHVKPLYRYPTKDELRRVAPDSDLQAKYREFLKNRETGLTLLVADSGCSENTNVISARANCIKYSMPGGGSSYSFRVRNYRIPRLADITFTRDSFQATGILLHGIFVNLGKIPVEEVGLTTPGLETLRMFRPTVDYYRAKKTDEILSRGFLRNGFAYRRALYIKESDTFALRSIAYRGKRYRSVAGVTYNELDFDKRRDVIVVFRIVRIAGDGKITLLWRILQNRKSPKMGSSAKTNAR
ncbi:MAG: hypothetical protein HKN25_10095 [Pyrinomonadaceae bacterium]|nr:hypothetical protein [Pyrinomonadaceae bacterium]